MNILLLSQFFSTTRGGGEYVFSTMAKKLAKEGHSVWIITDKIAGENYTKYKNIHLVFVKPFLEYKGGLPPGFLDNIRYSINSVRVGLRIVKRERIDIIHSNNFAPALAGSILSSICSKPHITTIHDILTLCDKCFWKKWGIQTGVSGLNVMLAPFFERLMFRLRHDCIHTVSEATRDDLIQFGAKKPIYIIPNTIEPSLKIDSEVNIKQFIYVGRLVFYKNLEVIIKAIKKIRESEPEIKLLIIGDGPYKSNLEEFVKKMELTSNIDFQGYVDANKKEEMIASSNALVFPSLCEGFGLVILEAFAQNRPVLVSEIRPMSDIVDHGKNGFVIDPYDDEKWTKYILELIQNPDESSIMGKHGNQLLVNEFNQDLMYDKLIKMYDDCVLRMK